MYLDKYIKDYGVSTDYPVFSDNIYKDIIINTKDLFLAQYKDCCFNAIDVVVKYLAIESYYGLNNYGFELYNKLQLVRTGKDWNNRFIKLIKSFESGYDNKYYLDTDLNYSIHDGAHRLALSLFHNIDEIKIRLFNTYLYRREYKFDYLLPYFNKEELSIIKDKLNELLSISKEDYYTILWPPALKLFNSIKNNIALRDGVEVVDSFIINLNNNTLKKFIYDIYSTDDIKKYKLDLKYQYMMNSINNNSNLGNIYPIDIIRFKMDNPDFRVKPLNGNPQSKLTMRLKTDIRDTYKKYINDYYYDIMMHTTDNNMQNSKVKEIIRGVK